jgi:hypothetical protein
MKKNGIICILYLFLIQILYGASSKELPDELYNFQADELYNFQADELYNFQVSDEYLKDYDCYQNAFMIFPNKPYGPKYMAVIDEKKLKHFSKEHGLYPLSQFLNKELKDYPVFGRFFQIDAQDELGKTLRKNRYGWWSFK